MASKSAALLSSNPVSRAFSSAVLTTNDAQQQTKNDKIASAYYRDSSGRASVQVRARLDFSDVDGAKALLVCGCIAPVESEATKTSIAASSDNSSNYNGGGASEAWRNELSSIGKELDDDEMKKLSTLIDTKFSFECTAASSTQDDSNNDWAVEMVTINNCKALKDDPKALLFDIEIAVRGNGAIQIDHLHKMLEEGELELSAVLRQKIKAENIDRKGSSRQSLFWGKEGAGLLGLDLGMNVSSSAATFSKKRHEPSMHYGTKIMRTKSIQTRVKLLPPLQLTVREVSGARAASGSTLVEITVAHCTRWHKEKVTVTGIAFHPGQSRLLESDYEQRDDNDDVTDDSSMDSPTLSLPRNSDRKSIQGGELSVVDMSRRVRWGFLPGSAPELPLVLGPHEAYSTVFQIDAGEDVRSRIFHSPVTVNAMIGNCPMPTHKSNDVRTERVMVTADVRWTSSRVGVENSDAFRLDMYLRGGLETACVGAPVVVSLKVLNLSMDPRDLMLLMAKDGEGRNSGLQWERPADEKRGKIGSQTRRTKSMLHNRDHPSTTMSPTKDNRSFNTAVVSEVNGYTFGVWGLAGDDDGTTRHHRDHELLAVDAALLLGEVKGQHSIEAELRFVPLREGTLDVPNLKLYDKRSGRWYNCVHTLKIVAAAKE